MKINFDSHNLLSLISFCIEVIVYATKELNFVSEFGCSFQKTIYYDHYIFAVSKTTCLHISVVTVMFGFFFVL